MSFLFKVAGHTRELSLLNHKLQNYSTNCGCGFRFSAVEIAIAVREKLGHPLSRSLFISWSVQIHSIVIGAYCEACVHCIEGFRISESPLWEVPLYSGVGYSPSHFIICS